MFYQKELLKLGMEIIDCPYYTGKRTPRCKCFRKRGAKYTHGPEMSFVGNQYGRPGLPRILFTRLNPVWHPKVGFMGTKESIEAYIDQNRDCPKEVFDAYLEGWTDPKDGKTYRGMQDAGTVTGHPSNKPVNETKLKDWRKHPKFGIQLLMRRLVGRDVFQRAPIPDDQLLQFCAINNVVKCAGPAGQSANPSKQMSINCGYHVDELSILKPHIIVAFGNKADRYLRRQIGAKVPVFELPSGLSCSYAKFPHPCRSGPCSWKGKDFPDIPLPDLPEEPSNDDHEFRAGPGGASTKRLLRIVEYFVCEVKRLSNGLT